MSNTGLLVTFLLAGLAAVSFRIIQSIYRSYTSEPYDFYKSKDYYVWTSPYSGWNERATELPKRTLIAEADLVCAVGVSGMGGHSFISAFFEPGIIVRGDGKILQLSNDDADGFRKLAEGVRELPKIHQRDFFAIDHDTSCTSGHNIFLPIPGQDVPAQIPNEGHGIEVSDVFDPRAGPQEMRQSDYGVSISVNGFYKHYRRMVNGEVLPQCLWELLGLLEETKRICNVDGGVGSDRDYAKSSKSDLLRRMKMWRGMSGIVAGMFDNDDD